MEPNRARAERVPVVPHRYRRALCLPVVKNKPIHSSLWSNAAADDDAFKLQCTVMCVPIVAVSLCVALTLPAASTPMRVVALTRR